MPKSVNEATSKIPIRVFDLFSRASQNPKLTPQQKARLELAEKVAKIGDKYRDAAASGE